MLYVGIFELIWVLELGEERDMSKNNGNQFKMSRKLSKGRKHGALEKVKLEHTLLGYARLDGSGESPPLFISPIRTRDLITIIKPTKGYFFVVIHNKELDKYIKDGWSLMPSSRFKSPAAERLFFQHNTKLCIVERKITEEISEKIIKIEKES